MNEPTPEDFRSILTARKTMLAMQRLKENPDFQFFLAGLQDRIATEERTALEGPDAESREKARLNRLALCEAAKHHEMMETGARNVLSQFHITPETEVRLDALD